MKFTTSFFATLLSAKCIVADGAYTPRALKENYCEFLSDEECEMRDLRFIEQTHKRRLIAESVGTYNLLVIPLAWSDNPSEKTLPSVSALNELWNGVGVSDNIISGSIANYTNVNSYGKLTLSATVVDWITADNTEIYYAAGRSGLPNGNEAGTAQLEDALFYALAQLMASGFDFTPFDQDMDGYLDGVFLLHSGYSSENADPDCYTGRGSTDRIHSHWANAVDFGWVGPNGMSLGSYSVASAFMGSCNSNIARIGTITHEYIHMFGMPEMYDVAGPYTDTGCCVGGLGGYDIMASSSGQKSLLAWPGHLSPWNKLKMGWITPIPIESDGTYTARPSELFPDIYIISTPYPEGEYLLIEVRRPLLFDSMLWPPGGLLIYHVDDNAPGPGNQVRGFPGVSGWPGNGQHYVNALLQSDGQYGLEKAIDNGHMDDFWTPGKTLGPGNGEQTASSATYPNTDSYAFGVKVTGLTITNFVDNADGSVTFDVSGLVASPTSAAQTPSPTAATQTQSPTAPPPTAATQTQSPTAPPPTVATQTQSPTAPLPTVAGQTQSPTATGGTTSDGLVTIPGGGWPTFSPTVSSFTVEGDGSSNGEKLPEGSGSLAGGLDGMSNQNVEGSSASTSLFSFVVGSILVLVSALVRL